MISPQLMVALDQTASSDIDQLLDTLQGQPVWIKVGMESYYAHGPELLSKIKNQGFSLFLDLKFHDIPQTVVSALKNLLQHPLDMINIHCSGGLEMMTKARQLRDELFPNQPRPLLIGVTILTSLDQEMIEEIGYNKPIKEQCLALAQLAKKAGLDGVVCSPHESLEIKKYCGHDFKTVTPGIRLSTVPQDDQRRTATPKEAKLWGSDFLVVGRPITQSTNPRETVMTILKELT